ncbi:hypothetical protein LCGC14_3092410 [marine sediment metagenome]|uniref:Uncharacterized protein n=1 Tax=marine sediment metagenome TaxID=412755 RepID=A0A0F8WA43_9ZZZZ
MDRAGIGYGVGCWLGATSAALLEGLVEAGYDKPFWAFDRWEANAAEIRKAREQGVALKLGQNLHSVYLQNVCKVYPKIKAIRGRIPPTLKSYSGDPIEFCMFDAPKRNPMFVKSIHLLLPYFIPGVTVLGLLDYYFYARRRDIQKNEDWKEFLAPVRYKEQYKDHLGSGFFDLNLEFIWVVGLAILHNS